jgi:hypothetical protein
MKNVIKDFFETGNKEIPLFSTNQLRFWALYDHQLFFFVTKRCLPHIKSISSSGYGEEAFWIVTPLGVFQVQNLLMLVGTGNTAL